MTTENDILTLLEKVQTIARLGLNYAQNSYDRERYEQLLALAVGAYSAELSLPASEIEGRFSAELGHITPKIGADAAIFNEQGHILLMERSDGSGWCLPCGWVEPNESPAATAVREAFEETGLHVAIDRLVGVFTRKANKRTGPHTMVAVVHLCHIVSGDLTLSHEGKALRYFPVDAALDWHPLHQKYAKVAHKMWQDGANQQAVSC